MIVLDASAVVELLLRTSVGAPLAERLLTPNLSLHAPHLLDVEVTQVLRRFVAQGELTPDRARQALEDWSARGRSPGACPGTRPSRTSENLKSASLAEAREQDRPIRHLQSSTTDKEAFARQLLKEHPVDAGLICVLTVVEPCRSFEYHLSQDRDQRGLKLRSRKCLHLYKYYLGS